MPRLRTVARTIVLAASTVFAAGTVSASGTAPAAMPGASSVLAPAVSPASAPASPGPGQDATDIAAPSPLFVERRCPGDAEPSFVTHGDGGYVAFTAQGVSVTRFASADDTGRTGARMPGRGVRMLQDPARGLVPPPPARRALRTDRLGFVGADRSVRPIGRGPATTIVSYFRGRPDEWCTGLHTWHEVVYRELWPGVDVAFSATANGITYRVDARPGARTDRVHLAWHEGGASADAGDRVGIGTPEGPVAEDTGAGVATERGSAPVRADRAVSPVGADATLTAGSFFGGPQDDRGLGVAVDGAGNAYITGQGPSSASGDDDAFVVKVSADGSQAIYVAYIGGSQNDAGFDVAVDAAGHAYVTGYTDSNASSFPVKGGPDVSFNGEGDTLVAKLTPDGQGLVYAGYLGGWGVDFGEGIAVDADGSVYLTGVTGSDQLSFPVTVGPDLTFNGEPTPTEPDLDAFVARLKADPTGAQVARNLVYAGYVGGRAMDVGFFELGDGGVFLTAGHIALGLDGSAYLSGMTESSQATFPDGNGFGNLPGPDRTHAGGWDAWVARVEPGGKELAWAGYVGGTGTDEGFGMAVDAAGNAYFTGMTESAALGTSVGPDLTYGGQGDAFVVKVNADGRSFGYVGYLGGGDVDGGYGVAVGADGALTVIGYTESQAGDFPTVGGPDVSQNDTVPDAGDAFVCRLQPRPDKAAPADNYDYCGYIGGADYDQAFWVALDPRGDAYVVGDTASDATTFPDGDGLGDLPGFDGAAGGKTDAFLVKVHFGASPGGPPTTSPPTTPPVTPTSPVPTLTPPTDTAAPPTPRVTGTPVPPTAPATVDPTIGVPTAPAPATSQDLRGHVLLPIAYRPGR
jgi:hypothetical protein